MQIPKKFRFLWLVKLSEIIQQIWNVFTPNDLNNLACRVCGNIQSDSPWGEDSQCPNYDICDCCGVEFGYGDCTLKATKTFRGKWLENGATWQYRKTSKLVL